MEYPLTGLFLSIKLPQYYVTLDKQGMGHVSNVRVRVFASGSCFRANLFRFFLGRKLCYATVKPDVMLVKRSVSFVRSCLQLLSLV